MPFAQDAMLPLLHPSSIASATHQDHLLAFSAKPLIRHRKPSLLDMIHLHFSREVLRQQIARRRPGCFLFVGGLDAGNNLATYTVRHACGLFLAPEQLQKLHCLLNAGPHELAAGTGSASSQT
jgi:hypothetical protein